MKKESKLWHWSNSQYNAVMRGYEERQRLQRRAMEARTQEVYKKYHRFRSWTARSAAGQRTAPDGYWAGDTKAREQS